VDPARLPEQPTGVTRWVLTLASAAAGLCAGLGLVCRLGDLATSTSAAPVGGRGV